MAGIIDHIHVYCRSRPLNMADGEDSSCVCQDPVIISLKLGRGK